MEQNTFITNKDKLLSDIIEGILPKTVSLDVLVGYFYFSGYKLLSENLIDKHLRVLVGLEIDATIAKNLREINQLIRKNEAFSHRQLRDNFYDGLTNLSNNTDHFDTSQGQKSFKLFYEKIKNGSLEIRKTDEPCHAKMYIFEYTEKNGINEKGENPGCVITGSSNLSYSGLEGRLEINARFNDKQPYIDAKKIFDDLWDNATVVADKEHIEEFNEKVMNRIWIDNLYSPYLMYIRVLKEYFSIPADENVLTPYDITGGRFSNLKYQLDAIKMAISTIKNHNGAIIADVVGLGKSIVASTVARNLGLRTIIVCPPHLEQQWKEYSSEFRLVADVYTSGKLEQALTDYKKRIKSDEQYLIIVDEAHRYRNESTLDYSILHQICSGNKVALLTATPFNNRPNDIYAMLKLFQIPTKSTLKTVENLGVKFNELITAYKRITEGRRNKKLSYDTARFEAEKIAKEIRSIINPLVIRRSRIDLSEITKYKEDLKLQKYEIVVPEDPIELDYDLSSLKELYLRTLDLISEDKNNRKEDGRYRFKAARYKPVRYIKKELEEELGKILEERYNVDLSDLFGRQDNLSDFMRHLLVRRFESSEEAFRKSLNSMIESYENILKWIESKGKMPIYKKGNLPDADDFYKSDDDGNETVNEVYEKYLDKGFYDIDVKYLTDEFMGDVKADKNLLEEIRKEWFGANNKIKSDPKLDEFKKILAEQLKKDPQRKIVVFTEFADTADYLGEELRKFGLPVFKYTSADASVKNKETINENFDAGEKAEHQKDDYKILVATDAISEGYNLHRAGTIINYDIPYNPTRVIQRIGRINRINKKMFKQLYIYNYFPTDVGESETRTKEISMLKMAMIHAIMGEDTKALTKDEEVRSYFLESYRKELAASEEASWDNKYRELLDSLRGTKIEDKALQIPRRARTGRCVEKGQKGVLVFGKKGNDYVFKLGNGNGEVIQLTANDALAMFEAEENEKPSELSDSFDNAYQLAKEQLFKNNADDAKSKERARKDAMNKVKLMIQNNKRNDYLKDLAKIIEYDGLSAYELRFINKLKSDEYDKLPEQIDGQYLNRIITAYQKVDEGDETIILSEEFR